MLEIVPLPAFRDNDIFAPREENARAHAAYYGVEFLPQERLPLFANRKTEPDAV